MKCKMAKHSFILIMLLAFANLSAQNNLTQTVKGKVLDKDADYPLIGVNVILLNSNNSIGTVTDLDGNFVLEKVPVGRQTISFSYVGYKAVNRQDLLINSAKELYLEIEMEEDLRSLAEVVVSAKKEKSKSVNEMATVSARSMSLEELTRFSGTNGDVARMAQNYAGVSGSSDDRNDIIVRGNSPASVLWRMEGVDIPSPNHWASLGSTGGPISMLNSNNLSNSDFISGAFPAEYGNASAAVFDLKLRNGNSDKYEFMAQIGFNGFEGGLEGPIKKGSGSSFMVNYRYSTLGVFSAIGVDFGTGAAIPQYQDINFKINVPTKKVGRFSLWGLGGVSDITFEPEPENDNLFSEGDERLKASSETGILGFSHMYFFNSTTSSRLNVSYSAAQSNNSVEDLLEDNNFKHSFGSDNFQGKWAANWTLNKKINAKNRIKAGLLFDNYGLYIKDSILIDDSFWFNDSDFEGETQLYRGFAQWQSKFNEKFTMNLGLHAAYFNLNNSYTLEPRLGLSYQINPKNQLSLGLGMHSQLQPLPVYFNKDEEASAEENILNEELDFIRSNHLVLAWDHQLAKNMRLKMEAYYQSLSGLAVDPRDGDFSMANFGADFGFPNRVGLSNDGKGRNYGLDITLEQFLSKGFYYLLTASIFDSKFKGYNGQLHNTFYNSRYVVNLLAGKEFVLNQKVTLTLDARFNYAGGRRFTPIDLEASKIAGEEVRDNSRIYEEQYAPYIRPDFKIGIRQNAKKFSQTFSVDLQNFIGRENVFAESYNEDKGEISTNYQRGFFPDVRYQILF